MPTEVEVVIGMERPDTEEVMQLIEELTADLNPTLYPEDSVHGYSVEQLLREGVAFFTLRRDCVAAGCGGVQLFGTEYGELKRMYIRPQFRGSGYGRLMLDHLAEYARQHGVTVLRLETGIYQHAAIRLYEGYGFQRIPPFGQYHDDPYSLYYEKRIAAR